MNIIDPNQVQTAVLAWIAVISAVSVAAITALAFIIPKVAALLQSIRDMKQSQKDQVTSLETRLDDHSRRITDANKTIAAVALSTPAPESAPNNENNHPNYN